MGYTITGNTQGRISTNDEFRTWGSWISNAFANAGLVQTADTGQIDWSTVTNPTAVSTSQGYEIWRFNDALQNSAPVFLRFDYGSAAAGNTIPGLRWALGSGANGSGSITGFPCRDRSLASGNAFTMLEQTAAFANSTLVSYFSGDTGRFVLALNTRGTGSLGGYGMLLSMERTVDYNGAVTSDGVMVTYESGVGARLGQALWSPVVGTWMHESVLDDGLCMLTPQQGGGTTGSNTAIYPIFHHKGGGAFLNPGLNLFGYFHSEITAASANSFFVYGFTHTYMPLGNTCIYAITPRGNNSVTLLMRYE